MEKASRVSLMNFAAENMFGELTPWVVVPTLEEADFTDTLCVRSVARGQSLGEVEVNRILR